MQGTILGFTKSDTRSLDSLSAVFAGSWSKYRTSIDYRKEPYKIVTTQGAVLDFGVLMPAKSSLPCSSFATR